MTNTTEKDRHRSRKKQLESSEQKPQALTVQIATIPPELKALNRWVAWKHKWIEGRGEWAKVPFDPSSRREASSTDPATWCPFDDAVVCYDQRGMDGIGFMLGDGIVGVDLDDCRNPGTGKIEPWAAELIQVIGSYTEVSPSGTGVKILLKGKKPGARCRRKYRGGEVEVYDGERYFALTGHRVEDTPAGVLNRPSELDKVYRKVFGTKEKPKATVSREPPPQREKKTNPFDDLKAEANGSFPLTDEEVILRARRARNGDKFSRLMGGDTSMHGDDDSGADLALCSILCFWCDRDAGQIDRIFRQSLLMRDKWDEQRGETTYGERTVAKAVADCEETYREGREKQRQEATAEPEPNHAEYATKATEATKAPPPWPEPLDKGAFYGLPGEVADCLSPGSEADPAAILIQFLVGFGNALGRTAHFRAEGSDHFLNEYAVLVGKTSKGRKGSSWAQVLRPLKAVDDRPSVASVALVATKSWSETCIQAGGLSSGEGLIWHVRDPIMGREKVKEKGRVTAYQEVEVDPGVSEKRLMLVEEEFAKVLKQNERQGNTLSPTLRMAWDGKPLQTLTKNSPAKATGAHVSLIGHITADELKRYLSATETANGFGNRFLWLCVKRSKVLPEGGVIDEDKMTWIADQLRKALEFGKNGGEMRRDEEAKSLWAEVYEELSEGKPGLAGSLLGRGEAHVMRLACLYAVLDLEDKVRAVHLEAALAVWKYVERSVLHVFGDSLGDTVADEIMQLLRAAGKQGLTRTELRDAFGRHQSGERIGRALGLLLERKLARFERVETGGRPGERWFAV